MDMRAIGITTIEFNHLKFSKAKLILLNSISNFIQPLFTFLFSLLFARYQTIELWGEYIKSILLISILSQIISWGNKEFLLVEFSKKPFLTLTLWKRSIGSRSLLLIP